MLAAQLAAASGAYVVATARADVPRALTDFEAGTLAKLAISVS
jgi:hypothetical protein